MGQAENQAGASKKRRVYRCFLVRCWLEEGAGPGGGPGWRFTVQRAAPDSIRRFFTCSRDVVAHIDSELASCGAFRQDGSSEGDAGHEDRYG